MKLLTILGARPQFIKAATVSREIRNYNESHVKKIEEVIIHTGQHFDASMSDIFFEQLDIPLPDHNLGISSLGHGAMMGRMVEIIEEIIKKEKPDWVLVYGDTNSTLAGALASVKIHVPVAHVEAGLRSHNLAMPEEVNRALTDRVSSVLFCPTRTAELNLRQEGYPFSVPTYKKQRILNTGDVMFDATLFYKEKAHKNYKLDKWGLTEKNYVLCTLHRAENTDNPDRLKSIFTALRIINEEVSVVLPLHPRTRNLVFEQGGKEWIKGLNILEPVSYLEMQRMEMSAYAILTDSGGIQKEAYFHRVPCLTMRDETEWVETIEAGWNQLVGSGFKKITNTFKNIKEPNTVDAKQIYGDGQSALKILDELLKINNL